MLSAEKSGDKSFWLTLQINKTEQNFQVNFDKSFVPRMFDVDEDLRKILVGNPQATQGIIQTLTEIEDGKIIIFPVILLVWQEVLESELQIA
ncbi:MAG: hypothetical protein HC846_12880 [Blastocatellia bacterium]|nr:hypothetical protein [Blastocatellia bacterium]